VKPPERCSGSQPEEVAPPIWDKEAYAIIDDGPILVRATSTQGPERVLKYHRWSLRVECIAILEPVNLSLFLNFAGDAAKPGRPGRQSKYFKHWIMANGEVYTQILLSKILTPHGTHYVDMQSPAGEAWNVLVYNYDGDVYASDESRMLAEMKDWTFRLGNVHRDNRRSIFTSEPALQMFQASCNQALAGCSDCAFQPYCAADPVYHYATQGDMYGSRPTSGFCSRNMEVIKHLFSLIDENNSETMSILWSWIAGKSLRNDPKVCD
jgi:radical SAM protein with 4Fe4S-binding SPASM domain